MNETIQKIYKLFCKETKRSGGVLVASSITEWNNYLAQKLELTYSLKEIYERKS